MKGIQNCTKMTAIATMLAFSLIISAESTCGSVSAASKPTVAKSAKIAVGEKKSLSIKSNGYKIKKVSVKSADNSVAAASSSKKSVTISGKTAGKTTISVKIKATKKNKTKTYTTKISVTVSDGTSQDPSIGPLEEQTVTNQATLATALDNAKNARITLKTDEQSFDLKIGNYPNVDLVIDAPNAHITNEGVFRSITIKSLNIGGWFERAEGNTITVSTPDQIVFTVETLAKVKSLTYTGTSKNLHTIKVYGELSNLNIASAENTSINTYERGIIGKAKISSGSETFVETKDFSYISTVELASDNARLQTWIRDNSIVDLINITKKATAVIDGNSDNPTSVKAIKGAKVTIKAPNAMMAK